MPENNKLYELVAELITEQRNTNNELKQLRQDFNVGFEGLRQDFNAGFESLEKRVGRLEEEQKKTNVLLQQHGRDLIRIANLLEQRVVHWGDKVQLGAGTKKVLGYIEKVE